MAAQGPKSQKGLFLDLDGTLADSLRLMRTVYDDFLKAHRRQGSQEEFARLNGPSLREVIESLRATHGLDGTIEVLIDEYRAHIAAAYDHVAPTDGARDFVGHARSAGYKIAVVTSNTLDQTKRWLKIVGLANKIDAVSTGEMVKRGKPNPDIYLHALEQCACASQHSIAVEDTLAGTSAARAAGLKTFGLLNSENSAVTWPAGVEAVARFDMIIPHL